MALYRRARVLAEAGRHDEALVTLKRLNKAGVDEDLKRLAAALERQIRLEPRLEEIRELISRGKLRAAIYHLESVLAGTEDPEARALLQEAKRKAARGRK
jgi:predicted negative regulator of RcsB-dependent stress response